jgi:hypothetical protein
VQCENTPRSWLCAAVLLHVAALGRSGQSCVAHLCMMGPPAWLAFVSQTLWLCNALKASMMVVTTRVYTVTAAVGSRCVVVSWCRYAGTATWSHCRAIDFYASLLDTITSLCSPRTAQNALQEDLAQTCIDSTAHGSAQQANN